MLLPIAAIILGLVLLVWSADRFVEGAAASAKQMGVSTLIIGITIIGFGTSAPEIGVSIVAVLENTPNIAIGNALGSNIANIGLILGVTAILVPIPVASRLLKTEFPVLLFATAVMVWCLSDLRLGPGEGALLLGLLAITLFVLIREHRKHPVDYAKADHETEEMVHEMSVAAAIGWLLLGLVVLVGSSKLLVWGATSIALSFGISELIIGLTIIALGTSLPELAASMASLKKGQPDLAIGNVIGSNLLNSLAVIGIPAMLTEFSIDGSALSRDVPVVVGMTLLFILMSRFPATQPRYLTRVKGIMLFSGFVIYQLYLYYEVSFGSS